MLLILIVGMLAGVGCQQGPNQSRNAPGPTVGAPPPSPATPPTPRLLTGSFDATSTTAMGITGDLTLTVTTLTFSRGLAYETTPAASLQASGPFAKNAGAWTNLLGLDTGSTVEVRAVESEAVSAQAPNGGLCAPNKTTFIALASASGTTDSATLKMAAFKSTVVPGAEASETDLCGTFTYAPR